MCVRVSCLILYSTCILSVDSYEFRGVDVKVIMPTIVLQRLSIIFSEIAYRADQIPKIVGVRLRSYSILWCLSLSLGDIEVRSIQSDYPQSTPFEEQSEQSHTLNTVFHKLHNHMYTIESPSTCDLPNI